MYVSHIFCALEAHADTSPILFLARSLTRPCCTPPDDLRECGVPRPCRPPPPPELCTGCRGAEYTPDCTAHRWFKTTCNKAIVKERNDVGFTVRLSSSLLPVCAQLPIVQVTLLSLLLISMIPHIHDLNTCLNLSMMILLVTSA